MIDRFNIFSESLYTCLLGSFTERDAKQIVIQETQNSGIRWVVHDVTGEPHYVAIRGTLYALSRDTTTCQDCGNPLSEHEECTHCRMMRDAEEEVQSWGNMETQMYNEPDYYYDYEQDALEADDCPSDFEDEPIPPEYEPVSGRSKIVITKGDVWEVTVITYADGHREGSRRQLEDTCFDNELPF